jgi:hypothetical protein
VSQMRFNANRAYPTKINTNPQKTVGPIGLVPHEQKTAYMKSITAGLTSSGNSNPTAAKKTPPPVPERRNSKDNLPSSPNAQSPDSPKGGRGPVRSAPSRIDTKYQLPNTWADSHPQPTLAKAKIPPPLPSKPELLRNSVLSGNDRKTQDDLPILTRSQVKEVNNSLSKDKEKFKEVFPRSSAYKDLKAELKAFKADHAKELRFEKLREKWVPHSGQEMSVTQLHEHLEAVIKNETTNDVETNKARIDSLRLRAAFGKELKQEKKDKKLDSLKEFADQRATKKLERLESSYNTLSLRKKIGSLGGTRIGTLGRSTKDLIKDHKRAAAEQLKGEAEFRRVNGDAKGGMDKIRGRFKKLFTSGPT